MLIRSIVAGSIILGSMAVMATASAEPQRGGHGSRNDRVECQSNDYRFTRCGVDWREALAAMGVS
mgnify:CR=1 FL=1